MWDEDPLPDGVPIFDAARSLADAPDDVVRARFGDAALLIRSTDLTRPMVLAPTQSTFASGESTAEVRILLLPVRKQPGRNAFPYISVGRTKNNDVVILDATVSKFHAFFRDDAGVMLLQDCASRNGTYSNEERVPSRGEGFASPLDATSTLRFGSVTATYLSFTSLRDQLRKLHRSEPLKPRVPRR